MRKAVRKETDRTSVFMLPTRIRNCFCDFCFVIVEPIIAAWLEPNPGRKEQNGETNAVARRGRKNVFLFVFLIS